MSEHTIDPSDYGDGKPYESGIQPLPEPTSLEAVRLSLKDRRVTGAIGERQAAWIGMTVERLAEYLGLNDPERHWTGHYRNAKNKLNHDAAILLDVLIHALDRIEKLEAQLNKKGKGAK